MRTLVVFTCNGVDLKLQPIFVSLPGYYHPKGKTTLQFFLKDLHLSTSKLKARLLFI